MNFYAFHIGDYASATRHLSWVEDAAYRRLIDLYYIHEGPLPADLRQVYRLAVASTDEQREAIDIVLGEFFTMTENGYQHDRCDSEIAFAIDKKNKASQAAQTKWRIAKEKEAAMLEESERYADAMRTHEIDNANASNPPCEGNAPNPNPNPISKPKPTTHATPIGFAEFWEAYPKKVGKGAAEKSWKQQRPDYDEAIEAVKRQAVSEQWRKSGGQFIPNPATWLNQRRWEDGDTSLSLVVDNAPKPGDKAMINGHELTYYAGLGFAL